MQKQQKAPNLIKYDSPYNIEHGKTTIFTTRVWAYTGVLFIFMGLFMYILLTRTAIETVIFRASGTMYQQINDTTISNLYVIKLMNKTNTSKTLDIRVRHLPKTNLQLITPQVTILPYKTFESMAFVRLTKKQAIQLNNTLEFDIYENNRLLDHFTINYLHPF